MVLVGVRAGQECLGQPVLLVCSASHYPAKKNETDAGAWGAVL